MTETKVETSVAVGLSWFRVAVVYFVAAVAIGIVMGATGDFALVSVHAHMNLLGWEALALMGLIYHQLPKLGTNRLARAHFWLHNAGLPVLMAGLIAREHRAPGMEPVVGVASAVVGAAILLFSANILINGRKRTLLR